MTECRPPDETPNGAECWLLTSPDNIVLATWHTAPEAWTFRKMPDGWSPVALYRLGYRFHSIATPPENAT